MRFQPIRLSIHDVIWTQMRGNAGCRTTLLAFWSPTLKEISITKSIRGTRSETLLPSVYSQYNPQRQGPWVYAFELWLLG